MCIKDFINGTQHFEQILTKLKNKETCFEFAVRKKKSNDLLQINRTSLYTVKLFFYVHTAID